MRIVAIVEARMTSRRLPGKNMRVLSGCPMIEQLLRRLSRCESLTDICLATSEDESDTELANFVQGLGFKVFRGDLHDVLKRVRGAADFMEADAIVEVTGDCPLLDPILVDIAVQKYRECGADYLANMLDRLTFPAGLDIQVYGRALLGYVDRNANSEEDRANVTPYIYRNDKMFKLVNLCAPAGFHRPQYWLAVDTPEDFAVVEGVFDSLCEDNRGIPAIIDFLDSNPALANRNLGITGRYSFPVTGSGRVTHLVVDLF